MLGVPALTLVNVGDRKAVVVAHDEASSVGLTVRGSGDLPSASAYRPDAA